MRKRYITKVLSCEGYDFIHKIFKVDKLWRQISAPALIGFLPLNHSRYMYIKWIKLINDMQQFIDVLWKWFGDLQPGTIDTSKFHLDNTKIAGIIEEATYVQHTRGKVHKVIISSYIGEQLILQCNYLDVCFIIIYNFHN
jgi:hypothetical protein